MKNTKIKNIAKEVLKLEIEGLRKIKNNLGDHLVK